MKPRRLVPTALLAALALTGVSACGSTTDEHVGGSEGSYVTAGELQYQVQISRQLNPDSAEDSDYVIGLAPTVKLEPDEQYFAVFLRAWNRSHDTSHAASRFYLTDTTGKRYDAIPVDTAINRVAWRADDLGPGGQLPAAGSLARENTTQGGLVLFKVPVAAYDSRPLEFHIEPDSGAAAMVTLDV